MSVDPIILKIQGDIKGIQTALDKIEKESDKTGKKVQNNFKKSFNSIAKRVAAAFAIERIAAFTRESINLAMELEGVKKGFDRINQPGLLNELRRATKGTVSDLELMKQAVRANNFEIPLQELGSLFEFARRRAAETGESVDYLVNSIVLGIGRKSPLILDNLGISAVKLKEKLGGVSAQAAGIGDVTKVVGDIASEALAEMGEETDTTANNMAELQAKVENLQASIGEALLPIVDAVIDKFNDLGFSMLALSRAGVLDASVGKEIRNTEAALDGAIKKVIELAAEADESNLQEVFFASQQAIATIIDKTDLNQEAQQKLYSDYLNQLNVLHEQRLAKEGVFGESKNIAQAEQGIIEALKDQLKIYKELKEKAPTKELISEYNKLIKEVQTELDSLSGKEVEIKIKTDKTDLNLDDDLLLAGDAMVRRSNDNLNTMVEDFRTTEDTINDIVEEGLQHRLDQQEQYNESQRQLRDQDIDNARIKEQAIFQLANTGFQLFKQLATSSAKDVKDLAVFEALINSFLAITNVLGSPLMKTNPILATAQAITVGAFGLAQVANIKAQTEPSFFEGTDFVKSPTRGRNRDDVSANLHHGEAVIPARANKRLRGFAKAWIDGNEEQWLINNHPSLGLLGSSGKVSKRESIIPAGFDDFRLYNQSRRTNKLLENIAKNTGFRKSKYRHG